MIMETYKQLFIFLEGPDDERLFEKVCKPILMLDYDFIKIIKYAGLTQKIVVDLLKTLKTQIHSDYIFVTDLDAKGDKSFCVTKRKSKLNDKFNNIIDENKIVVVKEEIESWYLAGITQINLEKFKIEPFSNTEQIDKEIFISIMPKKFKSKTDFLIETLKEFSLETGIENNKSLKYFATKYKLIR